ncbi:hypothetical protein [Vibrio coralliirubri]|uniref:hypothetical protein n=1 Tax=Vibrio coralliirubri TaxID=1516159 RepID=UPI0015F2E4E1|nr:hypothetical protein [Vibrio coralliirubri]
MFKFLFLIFGVILSFNSYPHSGGLDSSGCHGGSQPYHCHRAPSEMVVSSSGQNRLKCSAGSRSQDCTGVKNSTTYSVPSSLSVGNSSDNTVSSKVKLTYAKDTNWRRIIPRYGYSGYESFVFTTDSKFYLNIKSGKLSKQTKARLISEQHSCKLILKSGSYSKIVSRTYSYATVSPSFFLSLGVIPNMIKTYEHFDSLYLDCGWFDYTQTLI